MKTYFCKTLGEGNGQTQVFTPAFARFFKCKIKIRIRNSQIQYYVVS
ncbi:hypothetical protein CHK_2203 [Christensenella hongkongensis]|uniref:Uncharacterized protein n=1 Tax=Christensenella hongkongensis TaxID=270498 RepID=A0A0M2NIQ9_9FIRM|nr:hypothetical protein CHK_2203 [Christensenella hongkongensis]